jgi:hypothetical protein
MTKKRVDPERHGRQCTACHHPERSQIDQAVIDFQQITAIAKEFNIGRRVLTRHASATGLLEKREANWRTGLLRLGVRGVMNPKTPTHRDGIAALLAFAKIDENGRYTSRSQVDIRYFIPQMTQEEKLALLHRNEIPAWIWEQIKKQKADLGRQNGQSDDADVN